MKVISELHVNKFSGHFYVLILNNFLAACNTSDHFLFLEILSFPGFIYYGIFWFPSSNSCHSSLLLLFIVVIVFSVTFLNEICKVFILCHV